MTADDTYHPQKMLFTEQDFALMSWHDNPIHAVAFGPGPGEVCFDIDYIFKWEQPLPNERYYRFWISPATLVFEDVSDLKVEHDASYTGLTILRINREDATKDGVALPKPAWNWTLHCVEATWTLRATGYRQLVRRPPTLLAKQRLAHDERGGFSFTDVGN